MIQRSALVTRSSTAIGRASCRAGSRGPNRTGKFSSENGGPSDQENFVEAMGLEPTNLLTASQALYQLSYAPSGGGER